MTKMSWKDSVLCKLLEIEYPIIQAPMAGASTPEMAAAAANAGALGSLGCAMYTQEELHYQTRKTQTQTNRSINLNFFVHTPPKHDLEKAQNAKRRLSNWYDGLEAGDIPDAIEKHYPFNLEICEAVISLSPKVASFHFGLPDHEIVAKLKSNNIVILSSATSVKEAIWLEKNGADAIIAQGHEAGGHSGWFLPRGTAEVAGSMALIPRIVDAVNVPVIASGGIMDGRGIAAALMLGATGVQIGTAFLVTPESSVSDAHKKSLLSASGDDTMLSKAFSGRNARTIVNTYANEMAKVADWPDFPIMNTLTGPIRKASAEQNKTDAIALWSGQAVGLINQTTTKDLIEKLIKETENSLNKLTLG